MLDKGQADGVGCCFISRDERLVEDSEDESDLFMARRLSLQVGRSTEARTDKAQQVCH